MDGNNIATELNELQPNNELIKQKIGSDEVRKASEILKKYKEGKSRLEKKIIANEEFWKLRQWDYIDRKNDDEFQPASAWLWNSISGRHADAMDAYPTCNIKPRQSDDVDIAKKLSAILPVIMEQNRYEETYSDLAWYVFKHGGGVQGVFWDSTLHNGLGDIKIKQIDFLNLFWEPGITDIQASTHLFNTELVNNDLLEQRYPQTKGKLGKKSLTLAKYLYDDTVDTSKKSVVVDWYYHTEYNGRKVLQYCKYVNDIVLYATENETKPETTMMLDPMTGMPVEVPVGEAMSERGLYDHGLYPFVCMSLYPIAGSICGYGLTDIGRDPQLCVDIMGKDFLENAEDATNPRYMSKLNSGINEDEYLNRSKKIVHYEGSADGTQPIPTKQLNAVYLNFLNMKIDELKNTTGNQDVANGSAPSGITAASAVAALQESAGKGSRDSNKSFYRAYRDVIYQVIELIRQFYDVPRTFRIAPDVVGGDEQFESFDNSALQPQPMANMLGEQMGLRLPEFDVSVSSEKANPYKKMEVNELAINFYNLGFFNPQNADQALMCLDMMDFEEKDTLMNKIAKNQTLQKRLLQFEQLALQLAQQVNPMLADQISQAILMDGGAEQQSTGQIINLDTTNENKGVARARQQALESTQV